MLGSPGLDSLSSGSEMKYPGECYSPKYVDQRDTYRGKKSVNTLFDVTLFALVPFHLEKKQ